MMRRLLSAVIAVVMIVCLLPLNAIEAKAASAMKASDKVVVYLKTMEGFTAVPRWDYVQWTVGFGNRCPEEHLERYLREGIPIEEANALFLEQLVYFEEQVNKFIDRNKLDLTQNEFDAVLSISYNCGTAWLTGNSDLLKAIIDGTTGNALVGIMTQWCTAGGEYLQGLMRRRITEADMYLHGRYNTQIPENYCYVFFDAGEGTASGVAQGYDCDLYAPPMVTAQREGYTFLGWYTAETGGVKVTYLDENLHQATLYAHWAVGHGGFTGDADEVQDGGVLVTITGSSLNVRKGPGTSYPVVGYVTQGEQVVITQVTMVGDRPWGKYEKGWISLNYTNYSDLVTTPPSSGTDSDEEKEEQVYEAPLYVTVVGKSKLTVYNGPDTGYPKVGTLNEGDEVLIVETYKMFTTWWGRLETGGWICLDRYVLLHNEQMLAHSVTVEVTNSYLNVRSGPGTHYDWLSSLGKGEKVEILAVEVTDTEVWGRFSGGWIALQYTTFDSSKLEQYWHHSYGDWYTMKDSTCVTTGLQRRDCHYCDEYETRELELSGHSYGDWYVSQEPGCTEKGQERRDCVNCASYEVREAESIGHTLGDWYVSQEATCTEKGLERRDCANCDYYEVRETESTGHEMGDWYVSVEPSFTEEGQERRDCANCDYFETRVLGTTEHDFGQWTVITEPTCQEPGSRQRECAQCGYVEIQQMDPLGHDFADWTELVPATCTEPGVMIRGCRVCGTTEIEDREPTGHDFGQWEVLTEATCTEDGLRKHTCQICDYTEEEVVTALGHNLGDWYVVTEATCTKDGFQKRNCENCDYSETQKIVATGHDIGDWYTVREATCSQYGQRRRDCANCDYSQTSTIAKTAHSFGDWYISVEPTYTADGEERRDCQNCNAYETRVKEFEGQVVTKIYATITVSSLNVRSGPGSAYGWVGYVVYGTTYEVYEQTTLSNGKVWGRIDPGWICLTGYTTLEEVTEVVGHTHSFGDWYTATQATCTVNGSERRDCTGCTHYETRVVAATGHKMNTWFTIREATAEQNGLERRDCKNCDYFEEREVEYKVDTITKVYATIIASSLNVRSGPGAAYSLVGYVVYGSKHEVFEQATASNGKVWGRIESGWICLTGYTTLETVEVEDNTGHTHNMSNWYTVIDATCTENGFMRRDCKDCDYYERKDIEATGHIMSDWYTVREATATEKGLERRECANCDHSEERATEYSGITVTKVYATINVSSLNVRSGPGSSYGWVGYVAYGNKYEVYEQVTASNGKVWGRIDPGWICLTGYVTLETVEETQDSGATEPKVMTVIGDVLNVRSGPGMEYDIINGLPYGTQVTVYEVVTVDGIQWGRIDQGWVCMDYLA